MPMILSLLREQTGAKYGKVGQCNTINLKGINLLAGRYFREQKVVSLVTALRYAVLEELYLRTYHSMLE